jgi:uncharacterized protein YpbB
MSIERNEIFELAFRFVTETAEPVFVTGKAGTGKTTFLKHLREHTTKNMLVAAPTGVAAIQAGGVTLHSLFQLPFHPFLPNPQGKAELLAKLRLGKQKLQLLRKMEVLVIDEISMVRCDVMDAVDVILRSARRQHHLPFGGVQLVCIGDLYQLPPVAQQKEWALLQEFYNSPFFFESYAVKEQQPLLIELKKIYRQKDDQFVQLLNKVRDNEMTPEDFDLLHKRYFPGFQPAESEQYITLTTHNNQADLINQRELNKLLAPSFSFNAHMEGEFPENNYPADAALVLKTGAQVMFLKNDPSEKKYFNGKLGVVSKLTETSVQVECSDGLVEVKKELWQNIRYTLNRSTQVLEEEVLGTFEQYPLRLAWAVTIHKSQGLTFEKVMIDAAAAFSSGQVYVALSRCTRLDGIVLLSQIPSSALISNRLVVEQQKQMNPRTTLAERFAGARQLFTQQLLTDVFALESLQLLSERLMKAVQTNRLFFNEEAVGWVQSWQQELTGIREIANRFLALTQQLLKDESVVENNNVLQERITAAAKHFTPVLQELQGKMSRHRLVTEHKEASVPVDELLQELSLAIFHCLYLQQYCETGFSVSGYLQHKLQMPSPKQSNSCYASRHTISDAVSGDHPELYQLLKAWRDSYCEEHGVPVFMVANRDTLKNIAQYLPLTPQDLLKIKGLGEAKVSKWGAEVLELIQDYCTEHHLTSQMDLYAAASKKEGKKLRTDVKGDTISLTKDMLDKGLSPDQIAEARKLTTGTIEGHILKLVQNGLLPAASFLAAEKKRTIMDLLKEDPNSTTGTLKSKLGDDFSFFEIRLGRYLFEAEKEIQD